MGCLMCPESSEKYEWFVNKIYPRELKPYGDIIIGTSSKTFKTAADKSEFIGSLNWQARKNGLVLMDNLTNPLEEQEGLLVKFSSPHFKKELFFEWIKTLGTIVKESTTRKQLLKLPNSLDNGISFNYNAPYTGGGIVSFEFRNESEKNGMLQVIRQFLWKVSSCVGCRSCEVECSFGAITSNNGKIKINTIKCIKCHRCYNSENKYCWRYKSMYKPETESNNVMRSIANYENFGLRENKVYSWVSTLAELGDDFFPWRVDHPLGKNMVKSAARIWFTQASRLIILKCQE